MPPLCFQQVQLSLNVCHARELDIERLLNRFNGGFDTIQTTHRWVDLSRVVAIRALALGHFLLWSHSKSNFSGGTNSDLSETVQS